MTVVYRIKEGDREWIRVIMKGAPEVVVRKCGYKQEENQVDIKMDESDRIKFLDGVVKIVAGQQQDEENWTNGLKTILYAYRDLDVY